MEDEIMDREDLEVKDSPIAGKGCFAGRDIEEGECVGEYTGTLRHEDDAAELYDDDDEVYLFDIDDELVIDATDDPGPIKYINHSCDPNCESEQEGKRVYIYALRDIKEGEELSYDYHLQVDEDDEGDYTCKCGSSKCRGKWVAAEDEENSE